MPFGCNGRLLSQETLAERGKRTPNEIKSRVQRYAAMGWAQCVKHVSKVGLETSEQFGGAVLQIIGTADLQNASFFVYRRSGHGRLPNEAAYRVGPYCQAPSGCRQAVP